MLCFQRQPRMPAMVVVVVVEDGEKLQPPFGVVRVACRPRGRHVLKLQGFFCMLPSTSLFRDLLVTRFHLHLRVLKLFLKKL